MDDELKKEEAGSFEDQLAELIKQSGGVVPPKKPRPEPEPKKPEPEQNDTASEEQSAEAMPESEPVFVMTETPESEQNGERQKTPEEIEAEIEAIINGMGADATQEPQAASEPVFATASEPVFATEPPPFTASGDDLGDLMSQIEELEKQISDADSLEAEMAQNEKRIAEEKLKEAEHTANEGRMLDLELDAILEQMNAEETAKIQEQARITEEELRRTEEELRRTEEAIRRAEEQARIAEEEARIAKENAEKQARDSVRVEIVPPEPKPGEPVDVKFDKVGKEESAGNVSEMEQLRAKIASLEYMLSQKNEPKEEKTTPPPTQSQAQSATGMPPTGDITSMFKQWFDLEMAAKMKNIITEDDKKEKEKQPPTFEATPYPEQPDTGSPDLIKLSDNVFYNTREKKTYVMREISSSSNLPAMRQAPKPKPKKKPVKKAAHRRPRPHGMRPMRPHRPRRPMRRRP